MNSGADAASRRVEGQAGGPAGVPDCKGRRGHTFNPIKTTSVQGQLSQLEIELLSVGTAVYTSHLVSSSFENSGKVSWGGGGMDGLHIGSGESR